MNLKRQESILNAIFFLEILTDAILEDRPVFQVRSFGRLSNRVVVRCISLVNLQAFRNSSAAPISQPLAEWGNGRAHAIITTSATVEIKTEPITKTLWYKTP